MNVVTPHLALARFVAMNHAVSISIRGGSRGGGGLSESLGIDFYSGYRKKNPGIHFYSGFRGNAQVGIDFQKA